MKKRLLDLFCGAGGAGMGYAKAGYEVVGVDIRRQPHYPFLFVQADALDYLKQHGHQFDVIHASPPCQRYSVYTPNRCRHNHPDMISEVRQALKKIGRIYVIENVSGARRLLNNPILLCGSMFGLQVWRHRYFESNENLGLVFSCNHGFIPVLVTGTTRRKGVARKDPPVAERRKAMGIDWMTVNELDQAIPPAYTEFIGQKLLKQV